MDKQLSHFIGIIEAGGLAAAADRLNIGQPALTASLKKLEDRYGAQLVSRHNRGVRPTKSGELVYDHALLMQRLESGIQNKVRQAEGFENTPLNFACGHAWWWVFFKDWVGNFCAKNPDAKVKCLVGGKFQCADFLISGEVDLWVGHEVPGLTPDKGISFEPLFESVDYFYGRHDHPLVNPVDGDTIANYPRINSVPMLNRRMTTLDEINELSPEPEVDPFLYQFSSNSLLACIDQVRATDALFNYPEAVKDNLASYGVVPIAPVDDGKKTRVGIFTIRISEPSRPIAALKRHLIQAFAAGMVKPQEPLSISVTSS
ncbi:LysR family transcriptional regulator [Alphaproteobacteria bacterium]|nr:LysR family transcriptional regulator [Alphaproteobacteria bacterium]